MNDCAASQCSHWNIRDAEVLPPDLLLVFGSYQGRAELRVCCRPRPPDPSPTPLVLPILYCCSPWGDCGRRRDPCRTAVFLSGPAPCWLRPPSPEGSLWPLPLLANRHKEMQRKKKKSELYMRVRLQFTKTEHIACSSQAPGGAICGSVRVSCDLLARHVPTL